MTFPQSLTSDSIPSTVQQLMAEALQLSRYLLSTEAAAADPVLVARRRDRIRTLQQALKAHAHPIQRDRQPLDRMPESVRRAFVRAVLLVTRYHKAGGHGWWGTLPSSPTLSHYQTDPIPAGWDHPDSIQTLCQRFGLTAVTAAQLGSMLEQVDARTRQQQCLINAMLAEVTPQTDETKAAQAFAQLFSDLFRGITVPPEKLKCLVTPLQLYFCIEFPEEGALAGWETVTSEDLDRLRQLQQSLKSFSFEKFRRFPTFGPCDPSQVSSDWLAKIATALAVSTPDLCQWLPATVTILPLQSAEQFLLHDIWGHYWQLVLTQFEGDYIQLAQCDQPLRAHETAYTPDGPLACRSLFRCQGETVTLDKNLARKFFHGEVRQRLGLLFTHLLGEMTADVAEYKFAWSNPENAHQLPSSSVFTDSPTNLDLTLGDLDFLFLRVLEPLLTVQLSVGDASPLEADLLADWSRSPEQQSPEQRSYDQALGVRASLKGAIANLYQIFFEEYHRTYLPTLTGEVGVFTKIVSNLLHLQNVINALYTDPELAGQSALPFQDLIILFISSYCDQDSYERFWQIDDILARDFIPCWLHLKETIVIS
ncbi:MAG: hypothetical protein AAFV72_06280 [Cyanobacteria bacterium J06635_1]